MNSSSAIGSSDMKAMSSAVSAMRVEAKAGSWNENNRNGNSGSNVDALISGSSGVITAELNNR
jgi:hypothetical protein